MPDSGRTPDSFAPIFAFRAGRGVLSEYVDRLWVWRDAVRANGRDRMLPTGTASLVINLLEDELRVYDGVTGVLTHRFCGSGFAGVHARAYTIDTAEQAYVAGVSFRPGGAWPFMKTAQDELAHEHAPLHDVLGFDVTSLRDQLLCEPSPQAQLGILERTLVDHLCKPIERHRAVAFALQQIARDPTGAQMKLLSQQVSLSTRRFTRVFEQQVGLTPKLYARLLRFRHVLHEVRAAREVDWTSIALSCGYYDQPHFNRDFKAFSGFSPTEYLKQQGEFINHVRIE